MDQGASYEVNSARARLPRFPRLRGLVPAERLSDRLMLVTVLCVFVVEALIFLPNATRFRTDWLKERMNGAQIAVLALQAAPDSIVTDALSEELLERAGVMSVVMNHDGRRDVVLGSPVIRAPASVVDFRQPITPMAWFETIGCLGAPSGNYLRVIDTPLGDGDLLEMNIPQEPLRDSLRSYALSMFGVTLLISAITGAFVYVTLYYAVVKPILRLAERVEHFRQSPNESAGAFPVSVRRDELGRAEIALSEMEAQVRTSMRSKERLAALGGAVARISHDLRNSLTTAQLVSERLADSVDPKVQLSAPRLERALRRALALAENTLEFGRTNLPEPSLQSVPLRSIIEEAEAEVLVDRDALVLDLDFDPTIRVMVDADNAHRIFSNLFRNAAQAIASSPMHGDGRIVVSAVAEAGSARIAIEDNGPGVPARVRPNLFAPFSASTRQGGSGLGLAIARELAQVMGGDLILVDSASGAKFGLTLRLG